MKRFILLILTLLSLQSVNAQNSKKDTYYLSSELNFGNYIGLDMDLNYIFKDTYSLNLGVTLNIREPKSQPDDYSGGLNTLFSFGTENPYDQFVNYRIGFGKVYNFNEKETIRGNFSIGIGYSVVKEPTNWKYIANDDKLDLGENYSYTTMNSKTLSLIINPKIEFPVSNFFGFSVSPMFQINKETTYYGLGVGFIAGKLR